MDGQDRSDKTRGGKMERGKARHIRPDRIQRWIDVDIDIDIDLNPK